MNTRAIALSLCIVFSGFLFSPGALFANNLSVSNVRLGLRDTKAKTVSVLFDLAWDNSWRNKINHDAVWLTVRLNDSDNPASAKILVPLTAAGLNPSGSATGSGTELEVYVPADKAGAFIRRSANTSPAAVVSKNIMLTLNYAAAGFTESSRINVSVFGMEMVLVPQGEFYAGDGVSAASFRQGSADSSSWRITSESAISVTAAVSGGFFYVSGGNTGEFALGSAFTIPQAYPKGYRSFYCMKYEINEGQWVEFLNSLPASARSRRDVTDTEHKNSDSVLFRNTVACSGQPLTCSSARPARAMTYLTWMDLCAFLDWAALRPMTELEFEKAARGPFLASAGEYAWGNTVLVSAQLVSGTTEETGEETVLTPGANAHFSAVLLSGGDAAQGAEHRQGPLRGGIFATAASDRVLSGGSAYGVMDLSGNVSERVVTLGNAAGLVFNGLHGDGQLTTLSGFEGNANTGSWPGLDQDATKGVVSSVGSGLRAGSWADAPHFLAVSDRSRAALADDSATSSVGGRGVRSGDES